jgi:hypothetical protein
MLNKRDDIGIWRSIRVSKLKELLRDVPDDLILVIGKIGNPVFLRGDPGDEDNWEKVSFLDISSEALMSFGGGE